MAEMSKWRTEQVETANMNHSNTADKIPEVWKEQRILHEFLHQGWQGESVDDLTPCDEWWEHWDVAILIETDKSFFEKENDTLSRKLEKELRRRFYFLNLNSWQSLLMFEGAYCDYVLIAQQIYLFLKRNYTESFYLAVSTVFSGGVRELGDILMQLEGQIEEKYYHPDHHVFMNREDGNRVVKKEVRDSDFLEKISADISHKDIEWLWKHYNSLEENYRSNSRFSAMYVKFVFSSVIQELFEEREFAKTGNLSEAVERLYASQSITEILNVTRKCISAYENFITEGMEQTVSRVNEVKDYIYQNCHALIDVKNLARDAGVAPGYLNFVFRKHVGVSILRYIRISRMEKAEKMLQQGASVSQAARETGFSLEDYFARSYYAYYGRLPESSGQ